MSKWFRQHLTWTAEVFQPNGLMQWFLDYDEFLKNGLQVVKNPRLFYKAFHHWKHAAKKFYDTTRLLEEKGIKKETLSKDFKKFMDVYVVAWATSYFTGIISLATEDFVIKKLADKYGEKFVENIPALTAPFKKIFLSEEKLSELKLALLLKEKKSDFERELERHWKKFFWIENNYSRAEPKPIREFRASVRKLARLKTKKELCDEIRLLEEYETRTETRARNISKKLKIDEKDAETLKVFRVGAWWHDERKKINLIGNYWLNEFLKTIAIKTGTSLKTLQYAVYPTELLNAVDGNIDETLLKKRRTKLFVNVFFANGTLFLLTGRQAENAYRALDRKQEIASEVKGVCASPGKARGRVCVVLNPSEKIDVKGFVLVTSMTRPEFVPLMKRACAIVTNEGGVTSHAAVISRELKKPCVVGTKHATKILKDGDLVEVDAGKGVVKILKRG